jgi:predicted phosphate transport protein (TIGR00153 family)
MISFIPKEEKFFDLFEQSAENALKGGRLFLELLKDPVNIETKVGAIKDVEHAGDQITHETMEKLNKTFITPIDREDIHELICSLDDVIDLIETAAEKIMIFKVKKYDPQFISLAEILVKSMEALLLAITCLKRMKKPDAVLKSCIEANKLENDGDRIYRQLLSSLFDNVTDPIEIIKQKEIIEDLENAIDKCEDVANVLEGVVLKYA